MHYTQILSHREMWRRYRRMASVAYQRMSSQKDPDPELVLAYRSLEAQAERHLRAMTVLPASCDQYTPGRRI